MPTNEYITENDLAQIDARFATLKEQPAPNKELLSVPEVATWTKFTEAEVQQWITYGQPGRDGGHVLLSTVEVLPGCHLISTAAVYAYGMQVPFDDTSLLPGPPTSPPSAAMRISSKR